MAKKKKKDSKHKSSPRKAPALRLKPLPAALLIELEEVDHLTRRKRWPEAMKKLQELDQRYPNRPEILFELVNVCYALKDSQYYLIYTMRLAKLVPPNAEVTFALAGAYMANGYPALALKMYHDFIVRYPDNDQIDQAYEAIKELEPVLSETLTELGASGEDGLALAAEHDLIRAGLEQGDYASARQAAQRLLKRHPDFVPVLNNLSLLEFAEGQFDQAIAKANQVLSRDPENYQALANLVRYCYMTGRVAEAQQYAERLYPVQDTTSDIWLKKAEAFTYLEDDQRVLEMLQAARQAARPELPVRQAILYHLAAVAALNGGDEKQAKHYWQEALKLDPQFEPAQEHLNDLKLPPGERQGPWPFPLGQWLSHQAIQDLARYWSPALQRNDDQALARASQRYLQQHPELKHLVPVLLKRGDPPGRELALKLASVAEYPDLLAALKDFALSQHGPFELRHQALQTVSQAGLLPPGPVKMWVKGKWEEIMPLSFEIYDEPIKKDYTGSVQAWMQQAYEALYAKKPKEAEPLLKQALEEAPDDPTLLNNLKAAYVLQGRKAEADELTLQIYAEHPDYFFGIIGMAALYLNQNKIEKAEMLLKPLMSQKRLHVSEFSALCEVQIQFFLVKNMPEGAERWVEMWEQIVPDHPQLAYWKRQLALHKLKGMGRNLFPFGRKKR